MNSQSEPVRSELLLGQLPFASSAVRMKTILSNQTADIPEHADVTQEDARVLWGPQRNPVEGLQSHQRRTQTPGKKGGPGWTVGGEAGRNWLSLHHLFFHVGRDRGRYVGFHYAKRSVRPPPHRSCHLGRWVSGRNVKFLEREIYH